MAQLTDAEEAEHSELYELGVSRYLDKTDFSPFEWLDGEDLARFQALEDKRDAADAQAVELESAVQEMVMGHANEMYQDWNDISQSDMQAMAQAVAMKIIKLVREN